MSPPPGCIVVTGAGGFIGRPLVAAMLGHAAFADATIVVCGDAAHATTAHLASGGSLAIRDAVVLADEVARTLDVAAALAAYTERRYARGDGGEASVELLRLQRSHAPAAASGRLRAQAAEALRQPF